MQETFIGDTILHDGSTDPTYYTPPFGRRGEKAVFTIETTHTKGGPVVTPSVEHKNPEDTTWTVAGSFSNITGPGVSEVGIADLKEELRFALVFGGGSAGDYIHFLIPAPMWLPY